MPARKITINKCTNCLPYAAIAPRTANFVVAADDATDEQKDQADYICDAVQDEVELQAALDAVPATGGTVILLGAQFNITNPGSGNGLTVPKNNTTLWSPTFAAISGEVVFGKRVINIDADYARLANLKVEQTGTVWDEVGDAIGFAANVVNPVLDGLYLVTTSGYYAVIGDAGAVDALINNCYCERDIQSDDSTCENWRVLNCKVDNWVTFTGGKSVVMNSVVPKIGIWGDYCWIQGNKGSRLSIEGNYNYAIGNVLLDSAPYEAMYLQGNYNYAIGNYTKTGVAYGYGSGIEVRYGDQCTLIGNTCVDGNYGILIGSGVDNTRVIGNYCSGHETANIMVGGSTGPLHTVLIGNYAVSSDHYGIVIQDSAHYTLLTGNTAYNNVDPGIWLENAQHCVIKGNRVYNNQVAAHGEGGITLYGNVNYCILEGNKCFDTQGTKTQKYGIDVLNANCNDNVILGNDVRSNLTAGIHDAGTGTIIRNNAGYNPVGIASISVGASPFTHTAGASPETVYVSGGTVTSITKGGNNFGL
ncbi:MAG: NosD domain-containing protein, partial [Candidatus Methanospirareceae archaeon]